MASIRPMDRGASQKNILPSSAGQAGFGPLRWDKPDMLAPQLLQGSAAQVRTQERIARNGISFRASITGADGPALFHDLTRLQNHQRRQFAANEAATWLDKSFLEPSKAVAGKSSRHAHNGADPDRAEVSLGHHQRQTRWGPKGVGLNQQRRPTGPQPQPQLRRQPPQGPRCQPNPHPPAIRETMGGRSILTANPGSAAAS